MVVSSSDSMIALFPFSIQEYIYLMAKIERNLKNVKFSFQILRPVLAKLSQ